MGPEGTPDLSASTGSYTSGPSSTPCPPYKSYRPTPNATAARNIVSNINVANTNSNEPTNPLPIPNANPRMSNSACGTTTAIDPTIYPSGTKSLSGISLRAFLLGHVGGLSLLTTLLTLLYTSSPLWRAPFFLFALTTFHFLEYWVTAHYNTPFASISAFLLTQNGAAYNIAHTSALAECILSQLFLPRGYFTRTSAPFLGVRGQVTLGLILLIIGQIVRTVAMAQAGTNFTHTIQHRKRDEHVLVKDGVYAVLRHPSYFGFFWWGLGTQLVLGNVVCFVGYLVVLWKFFAERIKSECFPFLCGFGWWLLTHVCRGRTAAYWVLWNGVH